MESTLFKIDPDDKTRDLLLPIFQYEPLDHDAREQRFLTLHPCEGDKAAVNNHVRCTLEALPISAAGSFIAVKNTRGYRKLKDAIEVNGQALLVSAALEQFLRHFRRTNEPLRLWIRHICLLEYNPDEKERYWKRQFIDSMYERATEVANMAHFNTDLIDRGVIPFLQDSRYSKWTKNWHSALEKYTLPEIFPIKLQAHRPSNTDPIENYEYVSLDSVANEIRVAVIEESENSSAPLSLFLAHCPMRCEVDYHALSYTWGPEEPVAEIVLSGQKMRIRKNLEVALRNLRGTDNGLTIWIDAVCIDQLNVAEKNRQLARMGQIYDSAARVVCYIGEPDDDTASAIDFACRLQQPMMHVNPDRTWNIGPNTITTKDSGTKGLDEQELIHPDQHPHLCAALYKLLTRPYFKRVWVAQEIATASNPVAVCGRGDAMHFEDLDMAAYNLQDMIRRDPYLASQMVEADPTLVEQGLADLRFIRTLYYFRHLHCGGENPKIGILKFVNIDSKAPGFLETAILMRDFQATDSHDKLFALWNLARDKDGLNFTMDYSKPVQDVCINFATAWAKQHGSLDVIAAAEIPLLQDLPSWCPDWTAPSQWSSLVRREVIPTYFMALVKDLSGPLYSADGAIKKDSNSESPYFEFHGQSLRCTGMILDEIKTFFENPPELEAGFTFHPPDPYAFQRYHFWLDCIRQHYQEIEISRYKDTLQAATAMFHGDVVDAWLPAALNPNNCSEGFPNEEYVCDPELSRHIDRYAGNYSRTTAWDTVRQVFRGREAFVSKLGYMGLAPANIRHAAAGKTQYLAILATCSVPVILQENDDGSYTFRGACFVQGWMKGEVLMETGGFDSCEAYWISKQQDVKLNIV